MGMFKNAAKIEAKPTAAAKATKKEIPIEGLEAMANIDAAIKALEGLKASFEPKVKERALQAALLMSNGRKPDSFVGVDGIATGSMEFRKRGTNSALKEEENALLAAHGILSAKETIAPELFAINPKYAADGDLLGKVEAALAAIVPDDFIVKQEEKSKMVVSEANVEDVFKLQGKVKADEFESLVKVVITQAVKPKLAETNFDNVMAAIAKLLEKTDTEVEEA